MGEDRFTGWFDDECFSSETERAKAYRETVETAYALGVRSFSISPQETLLSVLKQFKEEHPDIVCIANSHMNRNYYVGNESLWTPENRLKMAGTEAHHFDGDCCWFKMLTGIYVSLKKIFYNSD